MDNNIACNLQQVISTCLDTVTYNNLAHNHPPLCRIVPGCAHCEKYGNVIESLAHGGNK